MFVLQTQSVRADADKHDIAAVALANIMDGVEKTVSLYGGIAIASNEQAAGVTQVNKGIEQLSQVVQKSSATAQEAAASSQELAAQAEQLKGMVSRFRLKQEEAQTATAPDTPCKSDGAFEEVCSLIIPGITAK